MPITYDTSRAQVNDSNGVYLISQLEKYDYILHQPLQYCSWSRDIDLREDITVLVLVFHGLVMNPPLFHLQVLILKK